ncbi:MAG: hypothetical protein RMJ88_07425 [Thermogemmata sp.]|nr:hypothetical protein [Thermogemmata sp.]
MLRQFRLRQSVGIARNNDHLHLRSPRPRNADPLWSATYRVVLTVDGKELSQPLVVENDPKADPKAIISFDLPNPTWEEQEDETARSEQQERRHPDEDDDTTGQLSGHWQISWIIAA